MTISQVCKQPTVPSVDILRSSNELVDFKSACHTPRMASFGFGPGDIVLFLKFSGKVISALREDGSKKEYQEAIHWCEGLQSVLRQIQNFERSQVPAEYTENLRRDCVAAESFVRGYVERIKKYDKAMGKQASKRAHLDGPLRKVQWALTEAKDLDNFRKSLDMQLKAVQLRIAHKTMECADLIPPLAQSLSDTQLSITHMESTLSRMQQRLGAWDALSSTLQDNSRGSWYQHILLERVTQLADIVLQLALNRSDPVAEQQLKSGRGRVFTLPDQDAAAAARWEKSAAERLALAVPNDDHRRALTIQSQQSSDHGSHHAAPKASKDQLEELNQLLQVLGLPKLSEAEVLEMAAQPSSAAAVHSALEAMPTSASQRLALPGDEHGQAPRGEDHGPGDSASRPGSASLHSSTSSVPRQRQPHTEEGEPTGAREFAGGAPVEEFFPTYLGAAGPEWRTRDWHPQRSSAKESRLNDMSSMLAVASSVTQMFSALDQVLRTSAMASRTMQRLSNRMEDFARHLMFAVDVISMSSSLRIHDIAHEMLEESREIGYRLHGVVGTWTTRPSLAKTMRLLVRREEIAATVERMESQKAIIGMILQLQSVEANGRVEGMLGDVGVLLRKVDREVQYVLRRQRP